MPRIIFVCVIIAVCGCGEDPIEHVQYKTPGEPASTSAEPAVTVAAPEWDETGHADGRAIVPVKVGNIAKGARVSVEGAVNVDTVDENSSLPIVNARIRRLGGKAPLICATGNATATREGGRLRYKIQVVAPSEPGRYDIEVTLNPDNRKSPLRFVVGEADVE